MKRFITIITILALTLTMFSACGEPSIPRRQTSSVSADSEERTNPDEFDEKDSDTYDESGSEVTSGNVLESGNEEPLLPTLPSVSTAPKEPLELYKPSEGEHRFEDILKDIEKKKTMSIDMYNGYTKEWVTAFANNGKDYFIYSLTAYEHTNDHIDSTSNGMYDTLDYKNVYQYYFFSYVADIKKEEFVLNSVQPCCFDPKTKTYYLYKELAFARNSFDFNIFSPKKWTYVSSGTDEINGGEYYVETYKKQLSDVDGSSYDQNINVAFNNSGDVVFIGAAEKDLTTPKPYADLTSQQVVLCSMFEMFTPIDAGYQGYAAFKDYVCLIREAPFYNQYIDFKISSNADSELFDRSSYTEVSRETYEAPYKQAVDNQISKSIDEELGLT